MEKSKGSKIVLLLIVLLLVILIVAGGAYAYIATDLLKSPDMLFKKYLLSDVTEVFNFNVGPYKDAYKRMENEKTEIKVTGKNEMNLGTSQYSSVDDESEEEQYLESTLTLKLDNQNKNRELVLDSKIGDEDYLNFDLLSSGEAVGIYVDGLHDKYISVENRDLKKLAETFNAPEEYINMIPDKIPELSVSNEDKEKILGLFASIVSDELSAIDKNSYTQESYIIDDYNGEKFEGNKYVLTISSKKLEEVITNSITNFVQNEELNGILKSKFPEELINKAKESILDSLKNEDESENTEQTIKIAVYAYNGKTIKLDIASNDEVSFEMYILNKEKSSSMQIRSVVTKTESSKVGSEELINVTSSFENNNGEISLEQKTTYNKADVKALKAEEEENDFWFDEDEFDEKYKNSTLSTKITTTMENDVITSKATITGTDRDKQTATYTMKFGNVDISTLKSDDMLVINDYTQEDFSTLMMEIMANGVKTAQEKPNSLIGGFFGFFGSFSSMLTSPEIDDENSFSNVTINTEEDETESKLSEADITKGKNYVHSSMETALNTQLDNYRKDAESDSNTNPGDYLTADKIEKQAGTSITNVEIVDGGTLKCEYKDSTYYVKIYIDGDTWKLDDLEVLYSEDGTIEKAE